MSQRKSLRLLVPVLATLGCSLTAPVSVNQTPENKPPTAPVVTISPSNPKTDADLKANVITAATDPEGAAVALRFQWVKNGSPQGDLTTDTVPASKTAKGDSWTVVVTPNDGKVDGTPGQATVTIANTAPTATVSFDPATPTGASGIHAVPSATDADGDRVTFTYSWLKDATTTNFASDTVPAAQVARGQTWQVTATPNDGSEPGAPVTASVTVVNTPPVLASVTLAPDAPTKATPLVAQLGDVTDIDRDGTSVRYAWTVNDVLVPTETSAILGTAHFSRGDRVKVTVTPNDGTSDGTALSATAAIGNAPPSIASVQITPGSGGRGATFSCSASGWADLDGDTAEFGYEWKVAGQLYGTSLTLSASALTQGQRLTCAVTPKNGDVKGATLTSSPVTIANTPPSLLAVTIGPANPREGDTITATPAGYFDLDGDPEAYRYVWKRNGQTIAGYSAETLPSTDFSKGQRITLEMRPFDGSDLGDAVTSNELTVVNTPPVLASVTLAPDAPTKATPLVAQLGDVTDIDRDSSSVRYAWTVNDLLVPTETSAILGTAHFSRGDRVKVTVTPNDGTSDGTALSATAVIGNAPPSIAGVQITPGSGGRGATFSCSASGWADLDGDTAEFGYEWKVAGQLYGTSQTLSASALTQGQRLICAVTPKNGDVKGATLTSSPVTIANTPPSLLAVTIGPANPRKADTITATPSGYFDLDGDPAAYRYVWKRNGQTIAGYSADTLPSTDFSKGQRITLEMRPFDGSDLGDAVTSNELTIVNTPPTMTGVSIAASGGGTPTKATALFATSAGVIDADGDNVTVRHTWTISGNGGTRVATTDGILLPTNDFVKGNTVTVTALPDDGEQQGGTVVSNTLTIQNAAPTAPVVTITPANPKDDDDLVCSVTSASTDADGDSVTYSFSWTKTPSGGSSQPVTGTSDSSTASRIAASATTTGDAFQCSVTATDGAATSSAATAPVAVGFRSCREAKLALANAQDGQYVIDPDGSGPIAPVSLFCDMTNGGLTLVANIYDSAGDDAPNSTDYVVSGWQQTASGQWNSVASTVARNSSGTGSGAVSLAFVAALKASGNQQNLKMCFVHQNGFDTTCRDSADGSMTLVSYATGNPKLTVYSDNTLPYTFGRLAGLLGQRDGYDWSALSLSPSDYFGVPMASGDIYEFGNHNYCAPGTGRFADATSAGGGGWQGAWHARCEGMSYRPTNIDSNELGSGTSGSSSGPEQGNPSLATYGFRLYVGP